MKRCEWCMKDDLYIHYHDVEWGVPVHDDRTLFEFLILEGMQAGLSWYTVLRKREAFRKAFKNFDVKKVARFATVDVERLMQDAGIIRNRLKIEAAVKNANAFIKIQQSHGSFDSYIWQFTDGVPIVNKRKTMGDIPATTQVSDAMSKDLKQRGFTFVGSTVMYAHMQATGMVNDHIVSCFRWRECQH